jgi:hypothetical protein
VEGEVHGAGPGEDQVVGVDEVHPPDAEGGGGPELAIRVEILLTVVTMCR